MQPCQDASKHVGTSHDLFSTLKDETHRTSYLGPGHHILHISWRNGRWTSRSCSDSCPIPTLCNPIYERRTDYNHLSVPIRLIDQPGRSSVRLWTLRRTRRSHPHAIAGRRFAIEWALPDCLRPV